MNLLNKFFSFCLPPAKLNRAGRATSLSLFVLIFFPCLLFSEDTAHLSIITPHIESIRYEFTHKFSDWYQQKYGQDVSIDWRNVGGSSDTLRFIRSEFSAKPDGIGLDLIFGCGVDPYYDLKAEGILAPAPLGDDFLAPLPPEHNGTLLRDPQSYWYGVTIASFGILHNLRVLEYNHLPLAHNWSELALPALFNWVAMSDPRNSGSMYTMMEAILQAYGWEKGWQILTGMAANSQSISRYASDPPRQTTYGNCASSLCIDFYGFTQVDAAGKEQMSFVIPNDFSILSPDCIALLKGAPHSTEGKRFIEFVLSEAGQKLWMFPLGDPEGPKKTALLRMPIRKDLYSRYPQYSPVATSPYESGQNHFQFNNQLAYKRRSVVSALIGTQLIDTHSELVNAWKSAIRAGKTDELLPQLAAPMISEEELLALLKGDWADPVKRNRLKIKWQTQAQDRYKSLHR